MQLRWETVMTEFTKKQTYNYYLPEELIAQTPAEPRDSSRLLVYNKNKSSNRCELYKIFGFNGFGIT